MRREGKEKKKKRGGVGNCVLARAGYGPFFECSFVVVVVVVVFFFTTICHSRGEEVRGESI